MIVVHVYCSYKLSPIGFAYGTFKYSPDNSSDEKYYFLSQENNNTFVRNSFESGIIRRVYGKIPNKKKYIFLIRKLKYDYGKEYENFGRDVDMNFAFEFEDYNKFKTFKRNFEYYEKHDKKHDKSEFYKKLADCIHPNKDISIFKLDINKKNFKALYDILIEELAIINGNVNESEGDKEKNELEKEQIKIITASKSIDYSQDIVKLYHLKVDKDIDIKRDNSAEYIYPVKKNQLKVVVTVALIVVLSIMTLVILKNQINYPKEQKMNQQMEQTNSSMD